MSQVTGTIGAVARAGDSIEDYCRACKLDRMHTVIASGQDGMPIRVACGYCGSEHNYRGGPRMEPSTLREPQGRPESDRGTTRVARAGQSGREPFAIVSERE